MTPKLSKVPRFAGLSAASPQASINARAASRKRDTAPELLLRRELTRLGLRYRLDRADLPGRPDIVFIRERVAVFCDGDFWHGRDLAARLDRLRAGHNAPYWVAKIASNVARDRRNEAALVDAGWLVLRYWETDVLRDSEGCAAAVLAALRARRATVP